MKTYTILAFLVLTFVSCKKEDEKIYGCLNPNAENYNPEANTSAECIIASKLVFWFDNETRGELIDDGVSSLHFYLEGELIGSLSINQPLSTEPSCNVTQNVMIFKETDSNNTFIQYVVQSQNGGTIMAGSKTITPGSCTTVQVTY